MIVSLSQTNYTIEDKPGFWASFIVWLLFVPHIKAPSLYPFRIAAVVLAAALGVVFSDLVSELSRAGFTILQFVFSPMLGGLVC